jgi:ribose 1,5-bisphosphokinase PhnN
LFNGIVHPNVTILSNDGALEEAGEAFCALLTGRERTHQKN